MVLKIPLGDIIKRVNDLAIYSNPTLSAIKT